MATRLTQFVGAFLAFTLLLGIVPVSAFADDAAPAAETVETAPAPTEMVEAPAADTVVEDAATQSVEMQSSSAIDGSFTPLLGSPVVTNEMELHDALADGSISTITLANSFSVHNSVEITRSVAIDGAGFTITNDGSVAGQVVLITASNVAISNLTIDASNQMIHGLQAYVVDNATLSNVTLKNAGKSNLMVNGSTVTVNSLTTEHSGWDGVNVDQGVGVTHTAVLTINGTSTHTEGSKPAIYVDDTSKDVHVVDNEGQYQAVPQGIGAAYFLVPTCSTDSNSFDSFTNGSVNGQGGWTSTGGYDQAIVPNVYGFSGFGCKALRLSNAVTSGSFSDQTHSYATANEAGETDATNGGLSGGTRQNHYEAQFDIASTKSTEQSGLSLSVSPDRGDGARMSYLRFDDTAAGINVTFYDVQGTSSPANFVPTVIATGLSRATAHTVRFSIDFVDGDSNDVVKIYIDGVLVHTGTTWENYYRFDPESNPSLVNVSRTINALLFRASGTPAATSGNGFLFDNVAISTSGAPVAAPEEEGGRGSRRNGSGGGVSGPVVVTTTTSGSTPAGQVLGAATFNFSSDLSYGSTGDAVIALQQILIDAGYLKIAAPTGWYGPLTQAAVKLWQAAHGVPATGYFGPLSRAAYITAMGGTVSSMPTMITPVTTTTTSTTTAQ